MTNRSLVAIFAIAVCLSSVWAVCLQRQQLTTLRAEQQQMPAQGSASGAALAENHESESPKESPASSVETVSPELLRLRSQVTQLSARQRELAGVVEEAERLRAQLVRASTNATGGAPLPPGYIRKAQAQFVGYSTPEDTIQSFLCALQKHDVTKLLQALTPEMAQKLQNQFQNSEPAEDFFKATDPLPGLAIRSRQTLPDGSVELQMEVTPGVPPEKFRAHAINGEWKLDLPF